MKIIFVVLVNFIIFHSYVNNEIIKLDDNYFNDFRNKELITTKGTIRIEYDYPSVYYYETYTYELPRRWDDFFVYDYFYKFKNVQNAHLFKTPVSYYIEDDTITFIEKKFSLSIDFICDFLFQTKYIDKFSYTHDNDYNVYFGGIPAHLVRNHYNYTFGDKPFSSAYFESIVSNINIEINNENKFKINIYDKLLFRYDKYCNGLICMPSSDFEKFKKQFDNFTLNNNYNFTMNNYSFAISFKISDKIFNISLNGNPYDYIVKKYGFSLGTKFMYLFDYREYYLGNKYQVNFYLNKNITNVHIYKEIIDDKKNITNSKCNLDLIYFCIFLFVAIFTVLKTYNRNKNLNINYFDYYQV